jgi:hypothetical protein
MTLDDAVADMINAENDRLSQAYFYEKGPEGYEALEAELSAARRLSREDVDGPGPAPRDAGARGADGEDVEGDIDAQGPDPLALARFDDPTGPTTQSLDDSLAHDVDMLFGPTPDEIRAALEAAGEGRMAGAVAQKPPGSDGGLFDTQDRTGDLFVQIDPDGDPRPLSDVLRDLDEDEASWAKMRSCMIPPAKGAEA